MYMHLITLAKRNLSPYVPYANQPNNSYKTAANVHVCNHKLIATDILYMYTVYTWRYTLVYGFPAALSCVLQVVETLTLNPLPTNDAPMRHGLSTSLWEYIWGI